MGLEKKEFFASANFTIWVKFVYNLNHQIFYKKIILNESNNK